MNSPAPGFLKLERVVGRLVVEDGFPSREIAMQSVIDYEGFFLMTCGQPGERLTPNTAIDLIWQRHMLDTRNYMEDCRKWAGGYVHRHSGRIPGGFERSARHLNWNRQNWGHEPADVHSTGGSPDDYKFQTGERQPETLEQEELSWLLGKTRQALFARPGTALWVKDSLKLLDENPGLILEEYRRFLTLLIHPYGRLAPAKLIDELWHQHILHSRDYFNFCDRIAGRYLHHTPGYGQPHEIHRPAFNQTHATYQLHYGVAPAAEIWSHMGESSSCSSSPYEIDSANEVAIKLTPRSSTDFHKKNLHRILVLKGMTQARWDDFLTEVESVPLLPPPAWEDWVKTSKFRWRAGYAFIYSVLLIIFINNFDPNLFFIDGGPNEPIVIRLEPLIMFFGFLYWIPCMMSIFKPTYRRVTPAIIDESKLSDLISEYQDRFGGLGITVARSASDIIVSARFSLDAEKPDSSFAQAFRQQQSGTIKGMKSFGFIPSVKIRQSSSNSKLIISKEKSGVTSTLDKAFGLSVFFVGLFLMTVSLMTLETNYLFFGFSVLVTLLALFSVVFSRGITIDKQTQEVCFWWGIKSLVFSRQILSDYSTVAYLEVISETSIVSRAIIQGAGMPEIVIGTSDQMELKEVRSIVEKTAEFLGIRFVEETTKA